MDRPPPLFPGLDARLRRAARGAALGGVGALLVVVGGGFLLAAAWLALAALLDAVMASLLLGLVLAGAGLIAIGIVGRRPPDPAPPPETDEDAALRRLLREAGLTVPPRGEAPNLTEAFLFGLVVAMRLRRGGPPRS